METEQGKLPPPPRLFASLVAGFDAVATHIAIILPPVLLDLFLWLGPHLSVKQFVQPVIDSLTTLASSSFLSLNATDVTTAQKMYTDFFARFNLFALLRTFPVGSTSLLSFELSSQNPLGAPLSLNAGSFVTILGWIMLLALVGWLFGAIYYHYVFTATLKPEEQSLRRSVKQAILLCLIWTVLIFVFGIPALVFMTVMAAISPLLGQIILFVGVIVVIWLMMPIFFSPHGIYTLRLNAFRSILNSLRLVRFTLPNTGLFLLTFLIINQGLNFLWNTPAQNTWWVLVGIAGHAFVSTALLSASFIYYRDIDVWLKAVLEMLQRQQASPKI